MKSLSFWLAFIEGAMPLVSYECVGGEKSSCWFFLGGPWLQKLKTLTLLKF